MDREMHWRPPLQPCKTVQRRPVRGLLSDPWMESCQLTGGSMDEMDACRTMLDLQPTTRSPQPAACRVLHDGIAPPLVIGGPAQGRLVAMDCACKAGPDSSIHSRGLKIWRCSDSKQSVPLACDPSTSTAGRQLPNSQRKGSSILEPPSTRNCPLRCGLPHLRRA